MGVATTWFAPNALTNFAGSALTTTTNIATQIILPALSDTLLLLRWLFSWLY
jgi:hypothetical protein